MSSKRTKGGYYAVKKGRNIGVFNTWNECEAQTKGFRDAKYKKFQTLSDAQRFLSDNPSSETMESVASSSTATVGTNNTKGKKRTFGREVEDVSSWDVVYSDGACKGNGKLGSIAGVGVWWGPNDPRNIAERCPGDQTNNRAELIAILRVLETTTISKKPLLIRTDSQYCINCFRSWIHNWRKNDWRNSLGGPVKNAGIIRCISLNLDIRSRLGQKVVLEYVKGHSGDTGNDGADLMANQGATLYSAAERDWESLEKELHQQFDQIKGGREGEAKIEILGPNDGEEEPTTEIPAKVRKVSSQDMAVVSIPLPLIAKPGHPSVSGASSMNDPSSLTTDRHSSTPVAATNPTVKSPVRHAVPSQPATPLSPQKARPMTYDHLWKDSEKSPLKVLYVAPSLVAAQPAEVNFNDYADCLLDDSDLANELSD